MTISKLILILAFLVFVFAALNVLVAHVTQVSMIAAGLALLVLSMFA